jgi:hypothetical protein
VSLSLTEVHIALKLAALGILLSKRKIRGM